LAIQQKKGEFAMQDMMSGMGWMMGGGVVVWLLVLVLVVLGIAALIKYLRG
jgi:hypothetical protein